MDRLRATVFRTRRVLSNAFVDLKYGSSLAVARHSRNSFVNLRNSDYAALKQIFGDRIEPEDVLVDVGCGTGRVINYWLNSGHTNRIIGIEMNEHVAERARSRLSRHPNVEIRTGDATELLPAEGTVFYMYNPFGQELIGALKERLLGMSPNGRRRVVLYYNCKHASVFEQDERFDVELVDLSAPSFAPLSPLAIITQR